MAKREWQIQGHRDTHVVRLDHTNWSGKATIAVDGEIVYHRPRKLLDFGLKEQFTVDGVDCLVRVIPAPWTTFWYQLWANGERMDAV